MPHEVKGEVAWLVCALKPGMEADAEGVKAVVAAAGATRDLHLYLEPRIGGQVAEPVLAKLIRAGVTVDSADGIRDLKLPFSLFLALRPQDALVAEDRDGTRWHRCLRRAGERERARRGYRPQRTVCRKR